MASNNFDVELSSKTTNKAHEEMNASCTEMSSRSLEASEIYERNKQAIVAYFKKGIKEPGNTKLGIELEHTILHNSDNSPVSYSEAFGVRSTLEDLRRNYPQEYRDVDGDLLGVSKDGAAITIEPASQIELSAGPFTTLDEARECYEQFEFELGNLLAKKDQRALLIGYNPSARALDMELIPKRRYKYMNRYLGKLSPFGPCMMRGGCSTQISIDYHSEEDCIKKIRLASALVPLLSILMDNSPIFEGEKRKHHLVRTKIWDYCDPARCKIVPSVFDDDFNFETYAEYILQTPAILIPCKEEGWCYDERTFAQIYAETIMSPAEVEHALSMFWTDIRLKTYIEIRPADAAPLPYVLAYAALIKGIFYNEDNLVELSKEYAHVRVEDIERAKQDLMQSGYEASVYGKDVTLQLKNILGKARKALANEAHYLEVLDKLVDNKTTLAMLIESQGITNDGTVSNTDKMVSVGFKGYFNDGTTFIDQSSPTEFPCCDGWMPPEIIDAVESMYIGQRRFIHVPASSAYEEFSEDRIIRIEKQKLPSGIRTQEGEMLNLEAPDGQTYPARFIGQDDECYIFDMNHQAICKDLNFEIVLYDVFNLQDA